MAVRQFEVREPESGVLIGSYTVDGITGDLNNYVIEEVIYTPPSLSVALNDTIDRINVYTGQVRSRFATNIAFQALAYSRKLQSCIDWDTAGRPSDLTAYKPLADEVALTGATPAQIYTIITTSAAQWDALLDITEKLRRDYSERAKLVTVFADLEPLYQDFVLNIELAVKV